MKIKIISDGINHKVVDALTGELVENVRKVTIEGLENGEMATATLVMLMPEIDIDAEVARLFHVKQAPYKHNIKIGACGIDVRSLPDQIIPEPDSIDQIKSWIGESFGGIMKPKKPHKP